MRSGRCSVKQPGAAPVRVLALEVGAGQAAVVGELMRGRGLSVGTR